MKSVRRRAFRFVAVLLMFGAVMPAVVIAAFRVVRPPLTTYMVVRKLADGATLDYRWVDSRSMSPYLARAVLAGEDTRFMQHNGFDWTEVESAVRESRHGHRLRCASTISMQCARTVFLWPGRSVVRKAVEAYLTVLLEALWPKQRILEVYLNVVEWGDGIYGCEAAAQHHFHTSCATLDAAQAARLAAILPNPRRWSATRPGPYVRERAATILARMPLVRYRVAVERERRGRSAMVPYCASDVLSSSKKVDGELHSSVSAESAIFTA